MLELEPPESQHIFAAAALEDAILECACKMTVATSVRRRELQLECEQITGRMRPLNSEHFESSPFISDAIEVPCSVGGVRPRIHYRK